MKHKLVTLFLVLATSVEMVNAYVEINGIVYNLNETELTAEVTFSNSGYYSGDVTIPPSIISENKTYRVTSIGGEAFYNCSDLTSISIPNSVTWIGGQSFSLCESLRSITIPNSVTGIGGSAFSDCIGLTYVDIPNSVTSLGSYAFIGCTSLTIVMIGKGVSQIGNGIFCECTSLKSISVDENNPYYCSVDGIMYNKNKTTMIIYPAGIKNAHYTIPYGVTNIGVYAFSDCVGLTSITISGNVTGISKGAFSGCRGLTTVIMENGVKRIDAEAFHKCEALSTITCKATTPPVCGDEVFSGTVKKTCQLHVPIESVDLYKDAEQWQEFVNVIGEDMSFIPMISYSMENSTLKIIRNGQFFIHRGNELFNVQGARVK